MRKQRNTERIVKGFFKKTASRNTLNTGVVKQRTMRSPIGMRTRAATQLMQTVECKKPYVRISRYSKQVLFLEVFRPSIKNDKNEL